MPRTAKELTAVEIARLKEPGRHHVGGVAGLVLQVAPGGARNWVLRVWVGAKRREHGLGGYPSVGLKEARERARDARGQIARGVDPILARASARSALAAAQAKAKTFDQCAAEFIKAKSPEWSNIKHAAQVTNTLATYAAPVLGRLLVADIDTPQVMAVLKPIWQTKTETATRVRQRIEAVLDWATVQEYRQGPNPARWKGHLDILLPKPSKFQNVEHHAALAVTAIPAFMAQLRQQQGMGAKALQFAILCAARSGEVRGATWGEIDLDAARWIIPAERMKAKREHRVPLSAAAIEVLKSLPQGKPRSLVFAGDGGKPLSDMTLTAVTRRMKTGAVPHGFRSSFRDWVAEHTAYTRDAAEMALAHSIKSKTEESYWRGDAFDKRRPMMIDWAKFCDGTEIGS